MGEATHTYAIIRESSWDQKYAEQPPAYVMLIEKETDASLMGSILGEGGKVDDWSRAFDTAPTYESNMFGSPRTRKRKKPGRVVKKRMLTRHETFDAAWAALDAAREAWNAADDRVEGRAAREAWSEVNATFHAEKVRLEAEMQERLAPFAKAQAEATSKLQQVRASIYARQTDAAMAAASSTTSEAAA